MWLYSHSYSTWLPRLRLFISFWWGYRGNREMQEEFLIFFQYFVDRKIFQRKNPDFRMKMIYSSKANLVTK